ncbi:MAG: limonene-1,2-epoxide hydrolase family protein [Pseudomonadales bacterium]|nr:limonene-1,2-epoxide hydrolase family protein [Pseudomonadales bacterium]
MFSKLFLSRRILFSLVVFLMMINDSLAQSSSSETENAQIIREFIAAWSDLDAQELAAYFSEDGTYYNIPTSPVSGRENVARFIAGFIKDWESTDWEIINLFAHDNLVVAERVDRTVVNDKPVNLPALGIFEMEAGKIKIWRDYFNLPTYAEAFAAALQQ